MHCCRREDYSKTSQAHSTAVGHTAMVCSRNGTDLHNYLCSNLATHSSAVVARTTLVGGRVGPVVAAMMMDSAWADRNRRDDSSQRAELVWWGRQRVDDVDIDLRNSDKMDWFDRTLDRMMCSRDSTVAGGRPDVYERFS